jgi:hypothetical protein
MLREMCPASIDNDLKFYHSTGENDIWKLLTAIQPQTPSPTVALHSSELAINDRNDKQNKHRDNGHSYNPICSHPIWC